MYSATNFPKFGFIPPNKNWSRNAGVTGTTSAADHLLTYLCDDRGGFPLRVNAVTGSWTITNPSGTISAVMIANHRVKVNAVFGGGITATVVPATAPVHDILLNPWLRITPVASVTSVTLGVTSNSENIIIGEALLGELVEMPQPKWDTYNVDYRDFDTDEDLELDSIPNYDEQAERRAWRGTQLYTTANKDLLLAWQQAQRGRSRVSMIVPDLSINDAWLGYVKIDSIRGSGVKGGAWEVSFRIVECPRTRW